MILICPVCGNQYDPGMSCPKCSFESHYALSEDMSGKFNNLENERIVNHKKWWDLQQNRVDKLNANIVSLNTELLTLKEENKRLAKEIKKPLAFLITENMVVYCIYEGTNSYGSSKVAEEGYQKIIIPGVRLEMKHFMIEAKRGERKYEFLISEVETEKNTLFLNSETIPILEPTVINDNDIIILVNNNKSNIRFRLNLNQ